MTSSTTTIALTMMRVGLAVVMFQVGAGEDTEKVVETWHKCIRRLPDEVACSDWVEYISDRVVEVLQVLKYPIDHGRLMATLNNLHQSMH